MKVGREENETFGSERDLMDQPSKYPTWYCDAFCLFVDEVHQDFMDQLGHSIV